MENKSDAPLNAPQRSTSFRRKSPPTPLVIEVWTNELVSQAKQLLIRFGGQNLGYDKARE